MKRVDWLTVLGLVVMGISLFGVGFWIGNKVKPPQENTVSGVKSVVQKSVEAVSVPGVHWIKAGEQPICPENYAFKGKYDSYTGYFYAPDHKGYDKIKPVVCFATEEYATKEAGFLKKY